jgi:hypothetical protein
VIERQGGGMVPYTESLGQRKECVCGVLFASFLQSGRRVCFSAHPPGGALCLGRDFSTTLYFDARE